MRLPTKATAFRALTIVLCALWFAGPAAAQSTPLRNAQARLEALGHSPGQIDGVMGPQTRDALREFQQKNDLPITGELDWGTQLALSASVRSIGDAKPAPTPKSAPVPVVAISDLPPPGADELDDSAADATVAVAEAAPSEAAAKPAASLDAAAAARPARDATPAPVLPPDGTYPLLRLGPAIGLALAAAGVWLALLFWMLRQRARRPDDAAELGKRPTGPQRP